MGRSHLLRPEITATVLEDIRGPKGKTQLARVEVRRGTDGWTATPTGGRGSNLISTVARANGLAIVPAGTETAPAGSKVKVMLFRAAED
jgi:molybdopterin biosynthesis enzyme